MAAVKNDLSVRKKSLDPVNINTTIPHINEAHLAFAKSTYILSNNYKYSKRKRTLKEKKK